MFLKTLNDKDLAELTAAATQEMIARGRLVLCVDSFRVTADTTAISVAIEKDTVVLAALPIRPPG